MAAYDSTHYCSPSNIGQHLDYPPKHKLTEDEVLAAARSIRELKSLRSAQATAGEASIKIGGRMASYTIPLEADEHQAVLALLIERHTACIAALGITPDTVPA